MRKTLIALAVAASAAMSGSAMAAEWSNSNSGVLALSGTLTPENVSNPWVIKAGDSVTGLDAQLKQGQKNVSFTLQDPVLALGIRTKENKAFHGGPGIAPQIDFNGAVDVNASTNGKTTLTLEVKDQSNNKIGTLTAPFITAAIASLKEKDIKVHSYMSAFASDNGTRAFAGGLAKDWNKVAKKPREILNQLSSEVMTNFDTQDLQYSTSGVSSAFDEVASTVSAAYGAGILSGESVQIALDHVLDGSGPTPWTASMPITISYK